MRSCARRPLGIAPGQLGLELILARERAVTEVLVVLLDPLDVSGRLSLRLCHIGIFGMGVFGVTGTDQRDPAASLKGVKEPGDTSQSRLQCCCADTALSVRRHRAPGHAGCPVEYRSRPHGDGTQQGVDGAAEPVSSVGYPGTRRRLQRMAEHLISEYRTAA